MDRPAVHILGAGAVGLSYGYLLSARGHEVTHTSLRPPPPRPIPVRARVGGETRQAVYVPRFAAAEDPVVADINLCAAPPAARRRYETSLTGAGPDDGPVELIFAATFDMDPTGPRRPWSRRQPALIFPLISCEHSPDEGLNLVTDLDVEALSRPGSDAATGAALEAMGLRVSARVGEGRFLARYVQTAAVYVVLSGLALGLLRPEQADARLLTGVLAELVDAAATIHPETALDFPDASVAGLEGLTPLIAAAAAGGPSGDPLIRNLRWLMSAAGRRKLVAHLSPFARVWADRPAAAGNVTARRLIDAVLAAQRADPDRICV